MENLPTIIWTVLAIALIIAEIFTAGFVFFWFGIGAMAAGLAAHLGFGIGLQFLTFAVVSIAFTLLSRTIFAKFYGHGDADFVKTGVDALPGKIVTVQSVGEGAFKSMEIKAFGSTWTAFPEDESVTIKKGEKVEVVRVEGATLIVKKAEKLLPDWREA